MAQSMAIGPIASAGLVAYLIAGSAGSAGPFVILLVFAGTLALGWTVSLYARRYAGAGAVYEYVARAHGPQLGVLSAGLYFLPNFVINGIATLGVGLLWQDFAKVHLGFDPGWWTGGVVSIGFVAYLVYRGVAVSTRTALVITAISAVPFLILAVAILGSGGDSGHTLSVFDPSAPEAGDIFRGVLFAILIFGGFESAAALGEESRVPHETIPRAILLSIALAGGFFLLMVYAATIGFGPDNVAREWGEDPSAFSSLGDRYVGAPLGAIVALAIVIDGVAVYVAVCNRDSRGVFALARDGLLPRPLAARSRHDTPLGGLAAVVVGSLAVLLLAAFFENRFDVFALLALASTLTNLPVFILLSFGALRFVRERAVAAWGALLIVAGAAVPALGIYGAFDPFPKDVELAGLWLAVAAIAAVIGWFVYLRARRPEAISHAAVHALTRPTPQDPGRDRQRIASP